MQRQFDVILTELLYWQIETPPSDTGAKMVLAVSGGVDSMCMAELFLHSALRPVFAVAHCNFHLRGEDSDGDEALVKSWAERNGVRFHRVDFDTLGYSREHSVSVEMAARELRYRWFASLCDGNGYDAVAVAHNANDNAETLVMNLLRGTGMRGLAGIRDSSPIPFVERGRIVRPLLCFTRKQIEGYAMSHGIRWREDRTNASDEYRRNKIRNSVFPLFEEINPSFVKTFNREMAYFAEAGDIVGDYCRRYADMVTEVQGGLLKVDVTGLLALNHWRSVLYSILEPYGFNSATVASLADLAGSERTFAGKIFVSDSHEILTVSDGLIVRKKKSSKPLPVPGFGGFEDMKMMTSIDDPVMVVRGAGNYCFNGVSFTVEVKERAENMSLKMPQGTVMFDADRLEFPLVCRGWRKGDWFRPLGLGGKKKVSDLFTDLKYNVLQKESSIVVVSPNWNRTETQYARSGALPDGQTHVSAILGVRIDDSIKVTAVTRRVVIIRIQSDTL